MILYGTTGEVSIGRLFAAGLVAGLIMTVLLMGIVAITSRVRGFEPARQTKATKQEILANLKESIWAIIFPVLLLGGIRLGIFTPSEVGAFACVYAIFVGIFIYKKMNWHSFLDTMKQSMIDVGGIMFMISMSGIFGYGIPFDKVPQRITNAITSFTDNFSTHGICALLAIIGFLFTAALHILNVKGSILIGIIVTWLLGIVCQLVGLYTPTPDAGFYSLIPGAVISADFSSIKETFGQCFRADWSSIRIWDFIVVIFAFLFVDLFDTLGTLIGVATKANMLDEEGRLPNIKPALFADAIGTSAGAVLGTSTVTTFVESASGVAVGGRTGLTAMVTGILFLLSMLFAPLFTAIPSFATAPALIMVGFLMVSSVTEISFSDDNLTEAIPAYIAIIAMPLFYSISEGISLGIISYVVLNLCTGKVKKVTPLMYILAILFILKYIFL